MICVICYVTTTTCQPLQSVYSNYLNWLLINCFISCCQHCDSLQSLYSIPVHMQTPYSYANPRTGHVMLIVSSQWNTIHHHTLLFLPGIPESLNKWQMAMWVHWFIKFNYKIGNTYVTDIWDFRVWKLWTVWILNSYSVVCSGILRCTFSLFLTQHQSVQTVRKAMRICDIVL